MGSKVIVNLPTDPFQQLSKKHDIVDTSGPGVLGLTSTDPIVRANQLEQNIRFLQKQHQIMLAGLHSEIETLRQKNRDLQFQVIFSKGVTLLQSSPSSDDDSQRKYDFSSSQMNITPLQVEILEQNIADLQTSLSEARTRNVYLQNVIDEQKKKMSALENEKLDITSVGKKIGKENLTKTKTPECESSLQELLDKLEDADRLIRRLRRENEEQRKEIVSLRTSVNNGKLENRRNDGNNTYRNYYRNGQAQATRFPPLHTQNYWRNSLDNHSIQPTDRGNCRPGREAEGVGHTASSLPYLRDRNNVPTSTGYSTPTYHYQGTNHKRGFYYHKKQEEHRPNVRTSRREQSRQ